MRFAPLLACALVASVTSIGHLGRAQAQAAAVDPALKNARGARIVGHPNGTAYLHALGAHASELLAGGNKNIGALVAIPRGKTAEDYGLEPVVPGIARLRAPAARIEDFGFAHPELRIEVAPPLHPLLDRTGEWVRSNQARRERGADGKGVMIGVADTGLDVFNPEMIDANGRSRVAWMLDLSLVPLGAHADLEQRFGVLDAQTGKVSEGAVLSRDIIDLAITRSKSGACVERNGRPCGPTDDNGHGTHVTGIAAGTGFDGKFPGIAPAADIVAVRLVRRDSNIVNDDVVRAVQFMFDRADAEKRPMVVNLSLGGDFGPHDGSFLWEQAIAAHVGPDFPGRALVAAAGNAGSIVDMPLHQSVRVTEGATTRVPIRTSGADAGSVQVWVTMREGASLKVGLDGPDGEWIAPVDEGRQNGKNTSDYNAGVIYGAALEGSVIPPGSRSAIVVWAGKWPTGTYNITLEGTGMAELYVEGTGDASFGGDRPATFTNGVREGTISAPATHPNIIAVGCTVNRRRWTSIAGADVGLRVPLLDEAGGLPAPRLKTKDAPSVFRDLFEGEVCWFSSAGPTATGVPKPEIAAPGALVVSALSRGAKPGTPGGIFTNPACPATKTGRTDSRCLQIDDMHGIANGTSQSSPVVAGVIAMLLQRDPTLTQDKIVALLQAGAHRFRSGAPFNDQSGPGEVDAMGSLDALDQMKNPTLHLPSFDQSWITLSSDYVPADGSTPVTAIVELRTPLADHRADFFDKNRLAPVLLVDSNPVSPPPEMIRRGPGVWFFVWKPPAGLGGSRATFGATFDGEPIVATRSVPIAADRWNASYPSHATGSTCSASPGTGAPGPASIAAAAIGIAGLRRRRRNRVTRQRS